MINKLFSTLIVATVAVTLSAFTFINSVSWHVKETEYSVKFSGGRVNGTFNNLKANIELNEADLANAKISASIDANSVNTGNGLKNKHARQGLGADKHPTIKFESTNITKKGNSYEAKGKLTLKGVTKDIVLPFTFSNNGKQGVFQGEFSVITKEYNITKSGTPDVVKIQLTVPVTQK